jgi:hypothetical protein
MEPCASFNHHHRHTMTTDYRALCAELLQAWDSAPEFDLSGVDQAIDRARAALAQPEPVNTEPDVDHVLSLAAIIRRVDGSHDKGAAALAEAILSHPGSRWHPHEAQPEPVGPTDEELMELLPLDGVSGFYLPDGLPSDWVHDDFIAPPGAILDFARAVLQRWGRPAITPITCDETTLMRTVEHDGRSYLVPAQPEPVGPTDEELLQMAQWHNIAHIRPDGTVLYPWQGSQDMRTDVLSFARAVLQRWGRPAIAPIPVSERLPGKGDLDDQGTCWMWHPVNFHYCLCLPDPSVHTHWLPAHDLPLPEVEV